MTPVHPACEECGGATFKVGDELVCTECGHIIEDPMALEPLGKMGPDDDAPLLWEGCSD